MFIKILVEFNPKQAAEFRLIGYETQRLYREDFKNERVDAGDIGAGQSVSDLYEITPADSPVRFYDELRYQPQKKRIMMMLMIWAMNKPF